MSWRDNLQSASFRGAEFFIDSHDYEFGRKNIFHDYPFRDDSELEDQGKATDGFTINGYVLASRTNSFDYFENRDKLIDALKGSGAGKLVHRYLGDKNVALNGKARMTETTREGGIARFQMTFKEVKQEQPASIGLGPISFMDSICGDSLDWITDGFDAVMDANADLASLSNDITAASQAMIAKIRELKSLPGSIISSATAVILSATALAQSVLSTPCDLAAAINGGFDSFLFAAGMLDDTVSRGISGGCSDREQNPEQAARNSDELSQEEGTALAIASAGLSTFGADLPSITVASPASAAELGNRQANINLTRGNGLIVACRMAVRTEFTSQDDAEALLLTITALIDAQLDYLGDEAGDETLVNQGVAYSNDAFYQAMNQLKPALKQSMDTIGANLAKIVDYDVGPEVLSSLTLAYDKYGDLDRDKEIVDRNPTLILNPCFIPNGKTISLLSE